MATYKQIQDYIKEKHGRSVKTCHIAHAKEIFGLPVKRSHNRGEGQSRAYPCPDDFQKYIKEAFQHFGDL